MSEQSKTSYSRIRNAHIKDHYYQTGEERGGSTGSYMNSVKVFSGKEHSDRK
jgi:hypothetical protein